MRFDCGTEDSLIEANRELDQTLTRMNIPHDYQEFPGGHDWPYWSEHVRETLAFCKAALA
jgi:enterochelin esterase-like enzyme